VASPCSGHGFKHSAGLGEALAGKACGVGPALDGFRLARFR
jgi:sarcosine oxidase